MTSQVNADYGSASMRRKVNGDARISQKGKILGVTKTSILIFALVASAGPLLADTVCRLELQERGGPQLMATLTMTDATATIEYEPHTGFLYPFTFDCSSIEKLICVTVNRWSLHAISFEYPSYAITLSVLDREAYGTAATNTKIRLWRIINCVGDTEFDWLSRRP
ncbi:hypothetical protein [Roseobacter sinensis]|uniref:Uncharacterized protein n=1 Tax=Roseobacter sinensis TaxID=2931391 RepID=A0ABT3BIX9_9RHOB|nr:hypothetical protein [Roseobacter sp. WL0113]MCV3273512.1 hypothetical protein [Roseobacter sp. WL0113]